MVNDWNEDDPLKMGNVHFITLELVSMAEMYKLKDTFEFYHNAIDICVRELYEEQCLNYKTIDKILNAFGVNEVFDYDDNEEIDQEAVEVYSPKETYKRFIKIVELEEVADDWDIAKMKETYGIE